IGRLDKGFETQKAQTRQFHKLNSLGPRRIAGAGAANVASASRRSPGTTSVPARAGVNRGSLVPKGWVEGCRIGPQNESTAAIPQPKERRYPAAKRPWPPLPAVADRRSLLWEKPLSILEIGGDLLLHLGQGDSAAELLAVDEEGRGRLHIELLRGALPHLLDAVEHLLVLQALVEGLLADPGLLADGLEWRQWPLHHPVALLLEQRLDQREVALLAAAARQHGGRGRQLVEREFAEDEADLAGVDIFALELRIDRFVEMGAVRTGHGGVFDDGAGRAVAAQDHVAERTRLHQFGERGILRQRGPRAVRNREADQGARAGECNRAGAEGKFTTSNVHERLLMLRDGCPPGRRCSGAHRRAHGPTCSRECGKAAPPCQGPGAGHAGLIYPRVRLSTAKPQHLPPFWPLASVAVAVGNRAVGDHDEDLMREGSARSC